MIQGSILLLAFILLSKTHKVNFKTVFCNIVTEICIIDLLYTILFLSLHHITDKFNEYDSRIHH